MKVKVKCLAFRSNYFYLIDTTQGTDLDSGNVAKAKPTLWPNAHAMCQTVVKILRCTPNGSQPVEVVRSLPVEFVANQPPQQRNCTMHSFPRYKRTNDSLQSARCTSAILRVRPVPDRYLFLLLLLS